MRGHVHRSASGTSLSASSMCLPHPDQVGFLHTSQITLLHMVTAYRVWATLRAAALSARAAPAMVRRRQMRAPPYMAIGTTSWRTALTTSATGRLVALASTPPTA